jgi:hypothetical protein
VFNIDEESRDKISPQRLAQKADTPFAKSVCDEIARLLSTEPFTVGVLRSIEVVAKHGRAIIVAQKEATISVVAGELPLFGDITGEIAPNDQAENFGAKALREMIGAATAPKPANLVQTVQAIAEAKKLGLDDIAKELQVSINGRQSGDEVVPT